MMYSRVCLLCIVVMLSLGEVLSRGGVEESGKVFSAKFDIIRPWDSNNCKLFGGYDNNTKCEMDLFDPYDAVLENSANFRYIMKLKIGSTQQEFKMKIDTGSAHSWVINVDCDEYEEPRCKSDNHYDPSESDKFERINDEFEVKYGRNVVKGMTVKDTVFLTPEVEVEGQQFGVADQIKVNHPNYDGVLGLDMRKYQGEQNPFLRAVAAEKIKEPIMGIYIKGGGSSAEGGEITFGGIKEEHLEEDTAVSTKLITRDTEGMFIIQMKKVMLGGIEACTEGAQACRALIDTGTSLILGPKDIVNRFNKEVLEANEELRVECSDIAGFPDIQFTIEGKTLTLKGVDYTYIVGPRCFTGIRGKNMPAYWDWQLGDSFLAKYYTKYNMKHGEEAITFYEAK